MNSLPTRGNETDTSKPAPEFSEAPAAATPKPAPASGNKKAPAKGKKPAAKNAKPAPKP
jgi:hypothetical protein